MKKILIMLALALVLVSLIGASRLHAPLHPALSSSNVCAPDYTYNWPGHVGNSWVEPGTTSVDTSTGTQVLIMPIKVLNVNNRALELHPEKQFTFTAPNGVVYPRAFGVPAVTVAPGTSRCFTLGFKFVPGGTGSAQCPFDGAILTYYTDINHTQVGYRWSLIWAPC